MSYDFVTEAESIARKMARAEDERRFNEWKADGTFVKAVLVCNRENKFKLKSVMPELSIVGFDLCGDDEVFMITDKKIAENIRRNLSEWRTRKNKALRLEG